MPEVERAGSLGTTKTDRTRERKAAVESIKRSAAKNYNDVKVDPKWYGWFRRDREEGSCGVG